MKVLDINAKQEVGYCIPDWLRDEQIAINVAQCPGRIAGQDKRDDPIALINFGPSLQDTWEKVKDFKYVMTCSGAHKFMIERGIIPTWHADVDPRIHKIGLIGEPHKDVEYLLAATCHPAYFKKLIDGGFNVKLWHIFDSSEDGLRQLPFEEWAITGGCSVGVRLLTLARFLGFTNFHIFGMDGNARENVKHAADHPNKGAADCTVEYKGVTYLTTPAMLEAARNTEHELDMLTDCIATFYGEGLVQAMMKNYKRKPLPGQPFVWFNKPELISAEYAELNSRLHKENLAYGVGGGKYAPYVIDLVEKLGIEMKMIPSVLDYGCGKGYLAKSLPFPIWEYDPAIPEKSKSPRAADIVICTDVLEHVERDKIHFVLGDMKRCLKQVGFFVIHTGPSTKLLADGRNSHLIQEGVPFWKKKLRRYFQVNMLKMNGPLLFVVVSPKVKTNDTKAT